MLRALQIIEDSPTEKGECQQQEEAWHDVFASLHEQKKQGE
jgi:hypothetical protein